jgi:hypothetical protein
MASKRQIRRKSCTGKVRHKSETESAAAAKSLQRSGKFIRWYSCKFCGGWHVGRPGKKRMKAIMSGKNGRGI